MSTPTTSTKAYTIPLPAPYSSSPYRFVIQHTTIGPATSLLYAGLASGSTGGSSSSVNPLGVSAEDGNKREQLDAYQAALRATATGPETEDVDTSLEGADDQEDVRIVPGCKNLGSDWAVGFPSRSKNIPTTSASLLYTPHSASHSGSRTNQPGTLGDDSRSRSIASRLATRTKRQVFLTLNIPSPLPLDLVPDTPGFRGAGMGTGIRPGAGVLSGGRDPMEYKLMLELEKGLVLVLEGKT